MSMFSGDGGVGALRDSARETAIIKSGTGRPGIAAAVLATAQVYCLVVVSFIQAVLFGVSKLYP